MDQLPLDGRLTDLRAFARLGEAGVDLFLVDSTNAEVPGFTTPERDIAPALDRVFEKSRQRVIVACFASHVHRVQQVLDSAVAHGRKVVYVGRSMVRNMGVARDLGYLKVPANTLIEMRDIENFKPEDVVIVCTGSQGEPMSALSRMAASEHPVIDLKPGDTVVLASSLIPGNENSVYRVINGLTRLGAKVVHKGNALVHVSGHASAGELLYCYNIVKPRNVMPVHGEARHLVANAELAIQTGIPRKRTILAEDGTVIDLERGKAAVVGKVDAGYIFVDGTTVGDISEAALTDRKILGEEGFISVVVVVGHAQPQGDQRARHPRPRFRRGRQDLRPREPAHHRGARGRPGRRHRRRLPAAAGHPPPARPLGQRHPPPPPDDRPGRRPDLRPGAPNFCAVDHLSGGRRHRSSVDRPWGRQDPPLREEGRVPVCLRSGVSSRRRPCRP